MPSNSSSHLFASRFPVLSKSKRNGILANVLELDIAHEGDTVMNITSVDKKLGRTGVMERMPDWSHEVRNPGSAI